MHRITLAVLAGGEGSRMGQAKSKLRVGDEPILQYLLRLWNWQGPTLLVTAPGRERPPGSESFGREVVDAVAGNGPLQGILSAIDGSETEVVMITTCDMPGVRVEQLDWLVNTLLQRNSLGLMLSRNGRVEPFPSIFRQNVRDELVGRLQRQE